MDWLGIGVFIIALGFAVLVGFLIPVLRKLTNTLDKTATTVAQAEKTLQDVTSETKLVLYNTNETLIDINHKVAKLDPVFDIVEEAGKAAHHLTSTVSAYTFERSEQAKAGIDAAERKNVKGLMKSIAFLYYLRKANKARTEKKTAALS
ncbi:DUF948 domain-containing protein [Halalkalibacter oceani]|uniref:DUF948 domain-containing protein n=1 Tax=Halalkalibacter oceani TaxID=1653776 RepID=A0A9X2DSQ0_9BACI|nr:DUF948 domain-containing protein [Halalkalibacter oceani]MCM3716411.1 DUF948 domain-containing protein [Halalkalibacter oceani]